jgi:hypothetical protein
MKETQELKRRLKDIEEKIHQIVDVPDGRRWLKMQTDDYLVKGLEEIVPAIAKSLGVDFVESTEQLSALSALSAVMARERLSQQTFLDQLEQKMIELKNEAAQKEI